MKKNKLSLILFLFLCVGTIYSQNSITYSSLSQTISTNSDTEGSATVIATCYGNSSTSILIAPTYCVFDNGLTSITYSNGTYLLPGQSSTITFKFKKTVSSDSSFTYKFSTNFSCLQADADQIKITVQYKYVYVPPVTCNLPKVTGFEGVASMNSVSIKWNKVPNALSYYFLYRDLSTTQDVIIDSSNFDCNSSTSTCSTVISGLKSNTSYRFAIRAECTSNPSLSFNGGTWNAFDISTLPPPPCPTGIPTNLSAIPYSGSWTIKFTPVPNISVYTLEYFNISTNSGGAYSFTDYGSGSTFFYYATSNQNFKFRLLQDCNMNTAWVTVNGLTCTVPSGLFVYSASGTGSFNWGDVVSSQNYQVEYYIFNIGGQQVSGTFTSASNVYSTAVNTSGVTGDKYVKFRVKSQCVNGGWSNFSDWSNSTFWNQ